MPNNIDAVFRSSVTNECYVFVKDKYVVVNYAPGGNKKDIIKGPENITDGFPMFANTIFQYKIDSSFDTGKNVAYFFSGDQCVKTDYSPFSPKARLLEGPIPIIKMFPCLMGTVFESGIDATLRNPNPEYVYLFKGDENCLLNFQSNQMIGNEKICQTFKLFLGTVFEGGIDAAFNSHIQGEFYIFKGEYYAHYSFSDPGSFKNGSIKLITEEWFALRSML